MIFSQLCPPALIYLVFSITQVVIDTIRGLYNTALMKIWVALVFTILLNYLCTLGLGIVSWFIVFVPFILMTVIVSILLLMFGLDPSSGKMKIKKGNTNKDNILDYYKSKESDLGGSSKTDADTSKNEVDESIEEKIESKKEKEKRILSRTLLFYKDRIEDDNIEKYYKKIKINDKTIFEESSEDIDLRSYKSGVNTITNMLYSMGEQDMATWYTNKSNGCIEKINGMTKQKKEEYLKNCQTELLNDINYKFNSEMKKKFNKNLKTRFPAGTTPPTGIPIN